MSQYTGEPVQSQNANVYIPGLFRSDVQQTKLVGNRVKDPILEFVAEWKKIIMIPARPFDILTNVGLHLCAKTFFFSTMTVVPMPWVFVLYAVVVLWVVACGMCLVFSRELAVPGAIRLVETIISIVVGAYL